MRHKRVVRFCFTILAALPCLYNVVLSQTPAAYAGMAQADITPPVGYAHYRGISTGVHDSLYAKAIVWGRGSQRFALAVCDLLWIDRNISSKVRLLVSGHTGIPYANMMIAATHDHTSPSYDADIDELNESLRPASYSAPLMENGESYPDWLAGRIAQAIIDANDRAQPVRLEIGLATAAGISFNRRSVLKDGTVKMNAGIGNPDIIGAAGPVDPRIQIMLFRRASDNRPIGCLSNFGLHADTFGGTTFSGDYPAVLSAKLRKVYGDDFISVFGTGACGDINHIDVRKDSTRRSSQQIGEALSSVIRSAIPALNKIGHLSLSALSEYVYAPLQQYSDEEYAWAINNKRDSVYNESSFLTLRRAVKIRSLHRMHQTGESIPPPIGREPWTIPLEVQVFRIGDAAIVGLPGELFTELSMAIKKASPFKTTFVIELTNRHIAYVPTKSAFLQGGYETINSRLAPGGGEMMVASAIGLLNKINQHE